MTVTQLTPSQIDYLNQFLEFDGNDPVTVINLYQNLDANHPELNQLNKADLQAMWSNFLKKLGAKSTNAYPQFTEFNARPHVQFLSLKHNYNENESLSNGDAFFNTPQSAQIPFNKQTIFKNLDHTNYTGVYFDPNLSNAMVKTTESYGINSMPDLKLFISKIDDPNPTFTIVVYAFNPKTNQPVDNFKMTFTGHFKDLASGQLVHDFIQFVQKLNTAHPNKTYHYLAKIKWTSENGGFQSTVPITKVINLLTGIPTNRNDFMSNPDIDHTYLLKDPTGKVIYTFNADRLQRIIRVNRELFTNIQYRQFYQFINRFLLRPAFTLDICDPDLQISQSYVMNVNEAIDFLRNSLRPGYELTEFKLKSDQPKIFFDALIKQTQLSQADQALLTKWVLNPNDTCTVSRTIILPSKNTPVQSLYIDDLTLVKELSALTILANCHRTIENTDLDRSLAQGIAKMIYAQQDQFNPNFTDQQQVAQTQADFQAQLARFNDGMRKFLTHLKIDVSQVSHQQTSISLKSIIDYIAAVNHHQPITAEMLGLIAAVSGDQNSSNDDDIDIASSADDLQNQKIIVNEATNANLFNKLTRVSEYQKLAPIKQLAPAVKKRIVNVYQIASTRDLSAYPQVKTLCHGTGNYSLLSILKSGLLTSAELRRANSRHWSYTGSGLGVGIYFARLDQAEKAANYTDCGSMNHYLFIADVGYHSAYDVDYYDSEATDKTNDDLIWAHRTGSFDRDELVAKSGHQVKLRYLIELQND